MDDQSEKVEHTAGDPTQHTKEPRRAKRFYRTKEDAPAGVQRGPVGKMIDELQQTTAPALVEDDIMLRLALDPNITPEKLRVMWDIQERRLAEERTQETERQRIVALRARAKMQAELPIIDRDTQNDQTKSTYSTLEGIWEVCRPIWTKHGFSVGWDVTSTPDGLIHVTITVEHEEGYVRTYTAADAPPDVAGPKGTINKTMVQGNQATVTFIQRGLLCRALGIVTRKVDDDGNSGSKESRWQKRESYVPNDRPDRPPADWVEHSYAMLDSADSPAGWMTCLTSLVPGAPSATECQALQYRLKDYVARIPRKEDRVKVERVFAAQMAAFAGKPWAEENVPKPQRSAEGEDADRAEAAEKMSADELWAEGEISKLAGTFDMDSFMVLAQHPDTQAKMKGLSTTNRALYERVKGEYESAHTRIIKAAIA